MRNIYDLKLKWAIRPFLKLKYFILNFKYAMLFDNEIFTQKKEDVYQ